ncbi:hypothetical protein KB879_06100 [Cupriavidus sp. KK10]|jgi:hypothetical protein|uniref:hypothetical protein n=1 Tax=Cupriavidus sp. KK10 TaxID=1478019 RepID=UPI001BABAD38|nr:hypothetical protein [Cupriavidus sp. KK10]QUN29518.1 hypothetical protein KB879_06100 [Cupriavidus sp. KK10]
MAKHSRTSRMPSITSIGARITEEQGLRLAAASNPDRPFRTRRNINADDIGVDQLAGAMKRKLARCRAAGRGGWDSPLECSIERLAVMLGEAVCKGDPVDVANFAMMLHVRGGDHQVIAEQAMRALLHGSRELLACDAERYRKLRAVPAEQLGVSGIPCISLPGGPRRGLCGADADAAVDAYTPSKP